ncbi:LLM class flavin-dependent oxidoreductase [Actinophytocola sp.]|uniref:LLM class flavin-dependent oxidoreductase n=1 Tax=Actinophytocola sp. TaxID=1872138 RepID=UPI002ED4BA0E
MRLGIELIGSRRAGHSDADVLDRLVRQARLAERAGYDIVWLPEHHDTAWNIIADPLLVLTHLAAATTRIGLGTSVVNLGLHNPVEIAERAALVNAVSGGRLQLGLGRGLSELDYAGYGLDARTSSKRFEHNHNLLVHRLTAAPETASIPIWIATSGTPRTLDLATDHGHGVLVNATGENLGRIVDHVRNRNPDSSVTLTHGVHIADDEPTAWTELEPYVRWFCERLALRQVTLPPPDVLRTTLSLLGDASSCAARIEQTRRRYGFDDFTAAIGIAGLPWPLFERTTVELVAAVRARGLLGASAATVDSFAPR